MKYYDTSASMAGK